MQTPMMTFRSVLLLLSWITVAVVADAAKYPNSVTLSYEVIGGTSAAVKTLATVLYDPKSLKYSLESWTPPSLDSLKSTSREPTSSKLLRILLPNGSSTVTSLGTFDTKLNQKIDLWLSPDGDGAIFSASITSTTPPPLSPEEQRLQKKIERAKAKGKPIPSPSPKPKSKSKKKSKKELEEEAARPPPVMVNIIPAGPGPSPKLNTRKPPQVDDQGREIPSEEEEPEKSFFQKYWWVFLIGAILTMATGGGDK